MIDFAIFLACATGYGLVAVHVGVKFYIVAKRQNMFEPGGFAAMAGGFWPIGIFVLMAIRMINSIEQAETVEKEDWGNDRQRSL